MYMYVCMTKTALDYSISDYMYNVEADSLSGHF